MPSSYKNALARSEGPRPGSFCQMISDKAVPAFRTRIPAVRSFAFG